MNGKPLLDFSIVSMFMKFHRISSSLIGTEASTFLGEFLETGIHPWFEQEKSPNLVEYEGLGMIKVSPIKFYGMKCNVNKI